MESQAILPFCKVREVKSPTRGTSLSAGIDFYVPEDAGVITIAGGERCLIPSGIKVNLKDAGYEKYALVFFNKSGVSSKKGLDVLACVVDADYQGEIHINLVNTGKIAQTIQPGDKIVQGLLLPIEYPAPFEVKEEDLFKEETERGEGGFGSTDQKV